MDIKVAILTISDRSFAGVREDLSGPELFRTVSELGWNPVYTTIIPDELEQISNSLIEITNSDQINLILTTGGTGYSSRDVTPEATLAVIEKRASGLVEKIRNEASKTNPNAILSRAEAGIRTNTLIINLPGSPKGAVESLMIIAPVLPHALELISIPNSDSHSSVKIFS